MAQFFSGRGAFLPPDLHRVLQGDDGEAQELSGRGHEAVRDGQEDSPGDLMHLLFLRHQTLMYPSLDPVITLLSDKIAIHLTEL